jgi:hypothetical protein
MAKKWLLLLVGVEEDQLPQGNVYTALPDKMDEIVASTWPGLWVEKLYLVSSKQAQSVQRIADDTAIDYHHYAVSVRGEKCTEEDCEQHPVQNVLSFHDHGKRHRAPPGVN